MENNIQKSPQEKEVHATILFLTHKKEALKEVLKPLLEQRKALLLSEDRVHHDQIESDFATLIRRLTADEIAKEMSMNPETVYVVVETMDVKEFLKSIGEA